MFWYFKSIVVENCPVVKSQIVATVSRICYGHPYRVGLLHLGFVSRYNYSE